MSTASNTTSSPSPDNNNPSNEDTNTNPLSETANSDATKTTTTTTTKITPTKEGEDIQEQNETNGVSIENGISPEEHDITKEDSNSESPITTSTTSLPSSSSPTTTDQDDRIRQLEIKLKEATATISTLTDERDALRLHSDLNGSATTNPPTPTSPPPPPSSSSSTTNVDYNLLPDTDKLQMIKDLQQKLEHQIIQKNEIESQFQQLQGTLDSLKEIHKTTLTEKSRLDSELSKLRSQKETYETNETLTTNRINELKKKETQLSFENKKLTALTTSLQSELDETKSNLADMTTQNHKLDSTLVKLKSKCVDRVKIAEQALQEERTLNEERKRKMKIFVETKSNELRNAKQNSSKYSQELQECRSKLKSCREEIEDLEKSNRLKDSRIVDVHGQLSRFKRDSERYLKMGDTLNQELEQSIQESEEHKNKRNLARHELMAVIRKLELEQSISGKLRDGLKFTFMPKALSQQQLLQEGIENMEIQIGTLAKNMGRPLPPSSVDVLEYLHPSSNSSHSRSSSNSNNSSGNGKSTATTSAATTTTSNTTTSSNAPKNKLENDANRLISNLEHETQRVSQGIMALQSCLERLHYLITDDSSDRGCCSSLSHYMSQYGATYSPQQQEDADHMML